MTSGLHAALDIEKKYDCNPNAHVMIVYDVDKILCANGTIMEKTTAKTKCPDGSRPATMTLRCSDGSMPMSIERPAPTNTWPYILANGSTHQPQPQQQNWFPDVGSSPPVVEEENNTAMIA